MAVIRNVPVKWQSLFKAKSNTFNTDSEPEYEITIAPSNWEEVKEELNLRGLKVKAQFKEDSDGDMCFRFRRRASDGPVEVFDRDGKTPWDPRHVIGNGSICNIQYKPVSYKTNGQLMGNHKLNLERVQVVEWKKYTSPPMESEFTAEGPPIQEQDDKGEVPF